MAMSIKVLPLFEQYCSIAYPYMSASVEYLSLSRIVQRSTSSRPPSINQKEIFLKLTLFGCSDRIVSPYNHVVPNIEPLPATNNNNAKPQIHLQHPQLPPANPQDPAQVEAFNQTIQSRRRRRRRRRQHRSEAGTRNQRGKVRDIHPTERGPTDNRSPGVEVQGPTAEDAAPHLSLCCFAL